MAGGVTVRAGHSRGKAMEIRNAWLSGVLTIVVPHSWYFEVGNVLGMKQPALAAQFMEILTQYGFEEEPAGNVYRKAFDLMKRFNVTFYDAAYHSVAISRSGTMITADDVYYRKTSRAGHISLLQDWKSD